VGSLHRIRDAVERGWPGPLEIHEHSHTGLAAAYTAGASRLPFGLLRGYLGTDLRGVNEEIRSVTCPYTGDAAATVPALRPDVTILHAQKADQKGNVLVQGIVGVQKEIALAAGTVLVTVEEVVDDLAAPMNAVVLPHWVVTAVARVPGGAHPSYAQGYYARDNGFYRAWDAISRDREAFTAWLERHVRGTPDHRAFLELIGATVDSSSREASA
jgi:glutaconate CoA-transferase subunit A